VAVRPPLDRRSVTDLLPPQSDPYTPQDFPRCQFQRLCGRDAVTAGYLGPRCGTEVAAIAPFFAAIVA
jgi:hypothetical protein